MKTTFVSVLLVAAALVAGYVLGYYRVTPFPKPAPDPVPDTGEFGTFYPAEPDLAGEPPLKSLTSTFVFHEKDGRIWAAPAGYVTDGASIPPALVQLVGDPFSPEFLPAAVIHDYYCEDETGIRKYVNPADVHAVFYRGLRQQKVDERKAKLMYWAVRHFGPWWHQEVRMRSETMTDGTQIPVPYVVSAPAAVPELSEQDLQKAAEFIDEHNPSLAELDLSQFAPIPPPANPDEGG